jgi:hypothetical protein
MALLTISGQSGSMGLGVHLNHVLRLSVCPSGLRVGIMKVFCPFSGDFFVPWEEISIERKKYYFMAAAEFRFGSPSYGKLIIANHVANRLAKSAGSVWPETAPVLGDVRRETFRSVFRYWLLGTTCASAFFLIISKFAGPRVLGPPWWGVIGFPALLFGIVSLARYLNIVKNLKD